MRHASDQELETALVEIERATGVLEAERARRIGEAERRAAFTRDGYLSATAWLVHRLRIAGSSAGRYLRWARALGSMPRTLEALVAGDVTASAAAVLIAAAGSRPEPFAEAEPFLVDVARTLPVRDLGRAVAYWRHAVDARAADLEERRRHELRRLHASATLDGMVRVDGDLDPENGQAVITAIRAVLDAGVRRPTTGAHRRSGGPTRSARSVAGTSTPATARSWRASVHT
ncbi:MAG TPA: DUF222 domain-containing protein [Actinomycetota bacterium]|nr:DUF222 domain-containing protein [Actinomycetota bacterium]